MAIADEWLRVAGTIKHRYDSLWAECNRCGQVDVWTTKDNEHTWPAKDGNYYGRLCKACITEIEKKHDHQAHRQ